MARGKKTGGRVSGTPNKITGDLRMRIKAFLDDGFEDVRKEWKRLPSKDKIMLYEKLLSFTLPRMRETDLKLNLDEMTDDQLNLIIDKILNNENSNRP